jgi:hypothetical protein
VEEMLSAAGVEFTFGGEGGFSLAGTDTNMLPSKRGASEHRIGQPPTTDH